MSAAPARTEQFDFEASPRVMRTASNDNRPSDIRLSQYYTDPDVAARFYAIFQEHFNPHRFKMLEPSAGTGSFSELLPAHSLAYDIEPRRSGIMKADFLEVVIESDRAVAALGNPPFGRNASMAVRFFNHLAWQVSVIALILPRSFRKAAIENRLDDNFHLVREEPVPKNAFLFRSKPYHVPAIFQIWERRRETRALQDVEIEHPDFEFTTWDRADFALQRVGARAGMVHHNLALSESSHYFIRGDVEAVMVQLGAAFAKVAGDVSGNPSLSKSEIVRLYRELTGR